MTVLKVPAYSCSQKASDKKYNLIKFMKKNDIKTLESLILKSANDPTWYWNAVNDDLEIMWKEPFKRVLDLSKGLPWCEWFIEGKCNIVDSILKKNIKKNPNKLAFIFINSHGIKNRISYKDLDNYVNVFALALKSIGVKKGDVVGIYLPMNLESFISIYACSKIGAIHVPIFSGYGKRALEQRLNDSTAQYLITSTTFKRRGKTINLKDHWEEVFANTNVQKIILADEEIFPPIGGNTMLNSINSNYLNSSNPSSLFLDTNDHDNNIFLENDQKKISFKNIFNRFYEICKKTIISEDSEKMDSSDPLFILYTSGTTGKPKGTIQTHGGYSVFSAHQAAYLVDLKSDDILFWYADIGWITGQTWVVYGCPIIGATAVVFEDVLDYPHSTYWADILDKLNVTIFGLAPTAIRQFIKYDVDLSSYSFKSLRLLVSTGEILNKDAWTWYHEKIGRGNCPVINLSGGTEIGGAILSTLPFLDNVPTSVGIPVPGFDVDIFDDNACSTDNGYLVIKNAWPSMTKGLLNDNARYMSTYWSKFPNVWFHGDKVKIDKNNRWFILGRIDDMVKISGHRIDPSEIEEILAGNTFIAETAVIGIPDSITGECLYAFCVLKNKSELPQLEDIQKDLQQMLIKKIGKFATPKKFFFVNDLPKNRSGKILRRLIKQKVLGNEVTASDLLILDNPSSLGAISFLT